MPRYVYAVVSVKIIDFLNPFLKCQISIRATSAMAGNNFDHYLDELIDQKAKEWNKPESTREGILDMICDTVRLEEIEMFFLNKFGAAGWSAYHRDEVNEKGGSTIRYFLKSEKG